jgi:hypothetical protein
MRPRVTLCRAQMIAGKRRRIIAEERPRSELHHTTNESGYAPRHVVPSAASRARTSMTGNITPSSYQPAWLAAHKLSTFAETSTLTWWALCNNNSQCLYHPPPALKREEWSTMRYLLYACVLLAVLHIHPNTVMAEDHPTISGSGSGGHSTAPREGPITRPAAPDHRSHVPMPGPPPNQKRDKAGRQS